MYIGHLAIPGIPFILSSLDPLLGQFFNSLLHRKYIYFGSPASLHPLRPHQTTWLWLPLHCPHQHHFPCIQEQARGEYSWPAPPLIGMEYLCQIPVELKQQPWLVSLAAVIAFISTLVLIHLVTRGTGVR